MSESGSEVSNHEMPSFLHSIPPRLAHLDISPYVEFREKKVVCCGAYGDVFRLWCTLPGLGRVKVAVKRLRFYLKKDVATLFEKEIYVWSKLEHPNVLQLLGFAFDKQTGYPLLVSRWMPNGSAYEYVRAHPKCDLIRLVTGTADGLAYLHGKGVVHSDIKPSNILVSDDGDALICDFGFARMIEASLSVAKLSPSLKGTTRYLAYELLAIKDDFPGHSEKTDVWAFGMTVYELVALEPPYGPLKDAQIVSAITQKTLPPQPALRTGTPRELKERERLWCICQSCWLHDAAARPDMATILDRLRISEEDTNATNMGCNKAGRTDVMRLLFAPFMPCLKPETRTGLND